MTSKIIFVSDIVEKNGKTVRENNLSIQHRFPVGSLVEYKDGERLYVLKHTRDCDGTPLMSLGMKWNEKEVLHCYGENNFTLIS